MGEIGEGYEEIEPFSEDADERRMSEFLEAEGFLVEHQATTVPVQTITYVNRGKWLVKVNQRMQSGFGLSGPGLGGRVRFVTKEEFARNFPASSIQDILVNQFMMPLGDRQGTILSSILRHHHQYDLLERLRDEQSLKHRLQQLENFVKDRIRAGGFIYSIAFGTQTIDPRRLVAELVAGITSTQASRINRRVLI